MLTPTQLENLPKSMVDLYAEVEIDIIRDMAARIAAHDDFIPAAEWQYQKLIEMGSMHDNIMKKLSQISGKSKSELEQLMKDAGVKAVRSDLAIYKKAGYDIAGATDNLQGILQQGLAQTQGLFGNLTRTTATTATKQFEHALDQAWLQINSGAFSPTEAISNAIKTLTDKGLAVIEYPSKQPGKRGHTDYLDVAVRRATVTGVNQTALKMQFALADEFKSDLVEVTAHAGARTGKGIANHAEWQGKVYSRSGTHPEYPSLAEKTGYGTGAGLGGWGCRHGVNAFIEGVDEPTYTQEELDDMNVPKYEYNGKKLTEYEATQVQRSNERTIRKCKREVAAAEAAGLPTEKAKANLAEAQRHQRDFIEQTGLKRQYDREKVE